MISAKYFERWAAVYYFGSLLKILEPFSNRYYYTKLYYSINTYLFENGLPKTQWSTLKIYLKQKQNKDTVSLLVIL